MDEDDFEGAERPPTVYLSLAEALAHWRLRAGRRAGRRGGLSKIEVARGAGLSQPWYRKLENGTYPRVRVAAVEGLVDVLGLNEDERQFLYAHTPGGGARTPGPATPQVVDPHVLVLLHLLPFPAYVTDDAWNVLAYNRPMAWWFSWATEPGANLLRWALFCREARAIYVDWKDQVPLYLALLRQAMAHRRGDHRLLQLRGAALEDPECRRAWEESRHALRAHRDGDRFRILLPHVSPTEMQVTSHLLFPATQPHLRFVVLTRPEDGPLPEGISGQGPAAP
ncbi:helix-turn-helix transcriptional regulator [Streptomyces sp. NPDC050085]|uniref:helix-turn-helix transcriptional regulator n=1 Tax=Streptomyces sp. NPDC050085 TaxID=3365600 RepID=UPI0037B3F2AA